jgi:hypothetical protein
VIFKKLNILFLSLILMGFAPSNVSASALFKGKQTVIGAVATGVSCYIFNKTYKSMNKNLEEMREIAKRLELEGITIKRMQKVKYVYNGYIITETINFSGSPEALKAHKKETDTFIRLDNETVNKSGGFFVSILMGLLGMVAVADGVAELL